MKNPFFLLLFALLWAIALWVYVASDPNEAPLAEGHLASKDSNSAARRDGAVARLQEPLGQRTEKIESLIRQLEHSTQDEIGAEERIRIARELNEAYFDSRSADIQKKISDALTLSLLHEKDLQVARAIALSHSRLYFDENTLPNLRGAYERKVLSFDDYYGELAHLYPETPPDVRREIVNEISRSHNRYAVDIVAGGIAYEDDIQLSAQEVADFQGFLNTNQPIFGGAADAFGYFDAIMYSQWLIAVSRLQHQSGGVSVEHFMGRKLLDPATDPRASVAFLISGYAKNLDESQKAELQWNAVQARAQELILRYPNSAGLQEIGKEMAQ
ncbi:hypothetical protein [Pantoea sp. 18069]|uniref:hypothetical protein n=1 Tax=Pantoea sp. 18069 TaxID=2681415 RepID=UPI001356D06A|nr:hypothetical protein [Pantoea sp. 18069]